jgi:hypothetical protein
VIEAVVFDVGETLVDETREYGTWADWLGTASYVLGGIRRGYCPGAGSSEYQRHVRDIRSSRAVLSRACASGSQCRVRRVDHQHSVSEQNHDGLKRASWYNNLPCRLTRHMHAEITHL